MSIIRKIIFWFIILMLVLTAACYSFVRYKGKEVFEAIQAENRSAAGNEKDSVELLKGLMPR